MSQWEHQRRDGYLSAMKALHRLAADDLEAKRGDIRPARTLYAYYDSAKLLLTRLQLVKRRA